MTYPKEVTLSVTSAHIVAGLRHNCSACPIALAAREAFPGHDAYVTSKAVYIKPFLKRQAVVVASPTSVRYTYEDPVKARCFIRAFDYGIPVEPMPLKIIQRDEVGDVMTSLSEPTIVEAEQ